MKVVMYRVNAREKAIRRIPAISFERILFTLFILAFLLLIVVQAALTGSHTRETLNISTEADGVPLAEAVNLFKEGNIVLRLINTEADPALKIMVNGAEVTAFDRKTQELSVKDGDVIEIDGSSIAYKAQVELVSVSGNIDTGGISTIITTEYNVKRLMKVRVK